MRNPTFTRVLSFLFVLFQPIALLTAPVLLFAGSVFREVFSFPARAAKSGSFSKFLALPKLLPFASLPRPRQMLAQMGHRTSLA